MLPGSGAAGRRPRRPRPPPAQGLPAPAAPRGNYVLGADPAQGNPTSDDSALQVLDRDTGEQCAGLAGKFDPALFAGYIDQVGCWYDDAQVMVERNNHGIAVLQWLGEHSQLKLLCGHDGKPGWLSGPRGKALLYDLCSEAFQQQEVVLHCPATLTQLGNVEGKYAHATEGKHDDLADALALAVAGAVEAVSVYEHRGILTLDSRPEELSAPRDDALPPVSWDGDWPDEDDA